MLLWNKIIDGHVLWDGNQVIRCCKLDDYFYLNKQTDWSYDMSLTIRTETKEDYDQVRDVNYKAFGDREDEANLVDRIRDTEYFVPQLSIVAELDDEIVGHLLMSKAEVVDGERKYEVIALAPIAVKPGFQKQGIGRQLITEGLMRCKECGFSLVLLIGHPTYYPKFGFKPARQFGLELKQFEVSDEVFMVYEVLENALGTIQGELIYPKAFFDN